VNRPPPIPSPPLEYRNPETSRGVRYSPWPALIASMFVYIFVAILMFVVLPMLEQVFKDFKTELTGITKLMLSFGRWFQEIGWLLLLPIPIVLPWALAQIPHREPVSPRNRTWRILNFTILALLLIGFLFSMTALMPLVSLIQTVNSPKK
jgi:hypothetical protein